MKTDALLGDKNRHIPLDNITANFTPDEDLNPFVYTAECGPLHLKCLTECCW